MNEPKIQEDGSYGYWINEDADDEDACEFINCIRPEEQIIAYMDEAFDKVWLCRTRPCSIPEIEAKRQEAVDRILSTYTDLPEDGFSDWECGYWNGILAGMRWVLGDEKDFLDT